MIYLYVLIVLLWVHLHNGMKVVAYLQCGSERQCNCSVINNRSETELEVVSCGIVRTEKIWSGCLIEQNSPFNESKFVNTQSFISAKGHFLAPQLLIDDSRIVAIAETFTINKDLLSNRSTEHNFLNVVLTNCSLTDISPLLTAIKYGPGVQLLVWSVIVDNVPGMDLHQVDQLYNSFELSDQLNQSRLRSNHHYPLLALCLNNLSHCSHNGMPSFDVSRCRGSICKNTFAAVNIWNVSPSVIFTTQTDQMIKLDSIDAQVKLYNISIQFQMRIDLSRPAVITNKTDEVFGRFVQIGRIKQRNGRINSINYPILIAEKNDTGYKIMIHVKNKLGIIDKQTQNATMWEQLEPEEIIPEHFLASVPAFEKLWLERVPTGVQAGVFGDERIKFKSAQFGCVDEMMNTRAQGCYNMSISDRMNSEWKKSSCNSINRLPICMICSMQKHNFEREKDFVAERCIQKLLPRDDVTCVNRCPRRLRDEAYYLGLKMCDSGRWMVEACNFSYSDVVDIFALPVIKPNNPISKMLGEIFNPSQVLVNNMSTTSTRKYATAHKLQIQLLSIVLTIINMKVL